MKQSGWTPLVLIPVADMSRVTVLIVNVVDVVAVRDRLVVTALLNQGLVV
jgi:hypothetical protein